MKVESTLFKDCFVLHPQIFKDDRGYFFESYNQVIFEKQTGLKVDFVQDNQSYSKKGTLRGLHFQKGKYQQAKLVRVVQGEVLDVIVDLRKNSPTYGQHLSLVLNDVEQKQLFIPRGFAHGFLVLSDTAVFAYKCDNYYAKEAEEGLFYKDPTLAIDWPVLDQAYIISDKDAILPYFNMIDPL
ncbi:dTDP-4-dehydrorhamnose 3,5-epimerase [Myroides odoratus]|uniref:dTDP-4-dehydrorhamnose 3,5-epimerase n=1 Tax=Myroides odoratus TaxID=256 RepID=A0A9Q6ZAE4_MYROD|nr:dTDP-4-dehydrorhamnose 3,5-epimerase [Myroides odoratus]EHQ42507.1 dTDP-4-dehydrorhamnose 3,5-epimerase [Myroides odoratus DSM 2801]EKB07888.1 dTDP-4-dehydrorhamnose 3,5-epimerase [Myroides odoratus CIP 103059]QQT99879.1 dTDP-4-dehydrorhamnose 3,5-epimerase [Myroides odoratus]WQD57906.1 dTDP-4-dehydrorhamnose 3,5-epimerase [Myroides odoratus]STZ29769.1 dTDP-4-dehydrorhamnose 3,5-epimerase [Myroides odoratus]